MNWFSFILIILLLSQIVILKTNICDVMYLKQAL